MSAPERRPAVYTTLYAPDAQSPFIAMVVLFAISLRRHNHNLPCVVFDYSADKEVAARLAPWQQELPFTVRPLRCDALRRRFEPRHVWGLRFDALLHVPPDDADGNVFIHYDADTLCLRDPGELANGDFDYALPRNPVPGFKISDWLAVFDLRRESTRRTLALACALNQEPHVWNRFDDWSSRKPRYPTSEACIEVAMRLLGYEGYQPLEWKDANSYLLHYARHERSRWNEIVQAAEGLLESTAHRERFEKEFGTVRSLVFREHSDYRVRERSTAPSAATTALYADWPAGLKPLRRTNPGSGQRDDHWSETARLLWALADGQRSVADIASDIASTLSAPEETVRRDSEAFYLEAWRAGRLCFAPRISRGSPGTPREPDFPVLVAILGLHASGSSCLAGVLQALGVYLGTGLNGPRGFEQNDFANICNRAIPRPEYRRVLPPLEVTRAFSAWLDGMRRESPARSIGAKHPRVLALVPELEAACEGRIRYVHIERPLQDSIASLIRREQARVPDLDPAALQHHQIALWEIKQVVLASRPNLTIDYYDLMARPDTVIRALVDYLELNPTRAQLDEARSRIRPAATAAA